MNFILLKQREVSNSLICYSNIITDLSVLGNIFNIVRTYKLNITLLCHKVLEKFVIILSNRLDSRPFT